jgi:porphobilinogen synthase
MPGVERLSIEALDSAGEAAELGVPAIAIFPWCLPALKRGRRRTCRPDNLATGHPGR